MISLFRMTLCCIVNQIKHCLWLERAVKYTIRIHSPTERNLFNGRVNVYPRIPGVKWLSLAFNKKAKFRTVPCCIAPSTTLPADLWPLDRHQAIGGSHLGVSLWTGTERSPPACTEHFAWSPSLGQHLTCGQHLTFYSPAYSKSSIYAQHKFQ